MRAPSVHGMMIPIIFALGIHRRVNRSTVAANGPRPARGAREDAPAVFSMEISSKMEAFLRQAP